MPNVSTQRLSRELVLAGFGLKLSSTDAWVIDRLTSALEDVHLQAGQALFSPGDPPEFVYFMHNGEVRSTREGGLAWTFRGKWLLGTFEALADKAYSRETIAFADVDALRLRVGDWLNLLEDSFSLARAAVLRSSLTVAHLEERIPSLPSTSRQALVAPPDASAGVLDAMHRLAFLADVRMLRGPGVQVLTDLAEVSTERSFAKGEVVLARGVERESLVVVVEGSVHASRTAPQVERDYGPGDLVCGAGSFGPQAPPWEAVATERTRVISFPVQAWFELMEEHFDLVRSTLAAIATRRELLLDHLAGLNGGVVLL